MQPVKTITNRKSTYRQLEIAPQKRVASSGKADDMKIYPLYRGYGFNDLESKYDKRKTGEGSWRYSRGIYAEMYGISTLKKEMVKQSVYRGSFKVLKGTTGDQGRDKIIFVDIETGAYYVMTTQQIVLFLENLSLGLIQEEQGVYNMEVVVQAKGGTCFIIPYSDADGY